VSVEKILVVDDEEDVVRAVGMRLKSAGYQVLCASDGLAATQMAVKHMPDLIILDIGMPGGDGHTVAQRLHANVNTMTIPIVFLTARVSKEDMEKASDVGAAGYLMKPFKSERLLSLVDRVIAGN
jgi:CheY-like chemotaxis protein